MDTRPRGPSLGSREELLNSEPALPASHGLAIISQNNRSKTKWRAQAVSKIVSVIDDGLMLADEMLANLAPMSDFFMPLTSMIGPENRGIVFVSGHGRLPGKVAGFLRIPFGGHTGSRSFRLRDSYRGRAGHHSGTAGKHNGQLCPPPGGLHIKGFRQSHLHNESTRNTSTP